MAPGALFGLGVALLPRCSRLRSRCGMETSTRSSATGEAKPTDEQLAMVSVRYGVGPARPNST